MITPLAQSFIYGTDGLPKRAVCVGISRPDRRDDQSATIPFATFLALGLLLVATPVMRFRDDQARARGHFREGDLPND